MRTRMCWAPPQWPALGQPLQEQEEAEDEDTEVTKDPSEAP